MCANPVVLVIDLEATCEKGGFSDGNKGEIIEIGICSFDINEKKIIESDSIMVKPVKTSVTEFCTNLTSITPEMAASGMDLVSACSILETQFKSKDRIWASWGYYDQRQFEYQCKHSGIPYPFGDRHINLKVEYTRLYKPTKKFRGMARAMEFLEIPLVGTHHRGVDDAINISSILARMLTDHPDWGKIWDDVILCAQCGAVGESEGSVRPR